jgi:hypothetical protein
MSDLDYFWPHEAEWVLYPQQILLQLDAIVFSEEKEKPSLSIERTINGHVGYHNEKNTYIFNDVEFLKEMECRIARYHVSRDIIEYEVQRTALVLASLATRVRAKDTYGVPYRTLESFISDERIHWDLRMEVRHDTHVRTLSGGCAKSGRLFPKTTEERRNEEHLDRALISKLACYAYDNALPLVWLRPFILT